MKYTDYTGKTKDFQTIDHSHLSNIYWFNRICNGVSHWRLKIVTDEIDRRFDGVILPYNPQWKFKQEIEYLEKAGRFIWNSEKTRADIIENGVIVGYYESPDYIRDEKLNKLLNE